MTAKDKTEWKLGHKKSRATRAAAIFIHKFITNKEGDVVSLRKVAAKERRRIKEVEAEAMMVPAVWQAITDAAFITRID